MIFRRLMWLSGLAVIGTASWWFFHSSPESQLARLREQVAALLGSQGRAEEEPLLDPAERAVLEVAGETPPRFPVRLQLARKVADRILEIAPASRRDLELRARIEELAGDPRAALQFYERVRSYRILPTWIPLEKGRLLRQIGDFGRARAEFLSVIDKYPYRVNLELGGMELDFLKPQAALSRFQAALAAAADPKDDPGEAIEALRRMAEAWNLRIAQGSGSGGDPPGRGFPGASATGLADRERERNRALDRAIGLLRGRQPRPDGRWVAHHLALASLHELYLAPDRLQTGITGLEQAVAGDQEHRYTALHLKLGQMKLKLAAGGESGPETPRWLREAEGHFANALDVKESTALGTPGNRAGDPAGEAISHGLLRDAVLLEVAEAFLNSPEDWRLLEETRSDRRDGLGLRPGLERIAESQGWPSVRALLLRGAAFRKAGKEAEGEELLRRAIEAFPEGLRGSRDLPTANLALRLQPQSLLFLKFLRRAGDEVEGSQTPLGPKVRLLLAALERHRSRGEPGAGAVLTLESELKRLVSQAAQSISGARDSWALASTVAAAGGRLEGIRALRAARDRLLQAQKQEGPEMEALRTQLASWLLLEAASPADGPSREAAWTLRREALGELLSVVKEEPYNRELFQELLALISRFRAEPGAPVLDLPALERPLFPRASREELERLAETLDLLAGGRPLEIASRFPALESAEGLRPFGSLLLAAVLFQAAQADSEGTEAGEPGPEPKVNGGPFLVKAREIVEKELRRSPGCLPLRIERARLQLADLLPGTEIPEAILEEFSKIEAEAFDSPSLAYPLYSLWALALERRAEYLARREPPGALREGLVHELLRQRRAVLRRAIRAEPDLPDAYLSLAESYLWPGAAAGGTEPPGRFTAGQVAALRVLEGAPETAPVLTGIARILTDLKRPAEALPYRQALVLDHPSEESLRSLISSYLECGAPDRNANGQPPDSEAHQKALEFLQSFAEKSSPAHKPLPSFPALKALLTGLIQQDRARWAKGNRVRALKGEAVASYREALTLYRGMGERPPVDAVNNLAWLLSEDPATLEEARSLIEEARRTLPGPLPAIEDTYGVVLHRLKETLQAEEVYRKLVLASPSPEFSFHFARVLLDLKKLTEAKTQIETALLGDSFDELPEARQLEAEVRLKLRESSSPATR